jgi:quercetin 2,3-dioxygenase
MVPHCFQTVNYLPLAQLVGGLEMVTVRKAEERGRADFGWLDSRHTFSFGDYYDPNFGGFGPLRVINDDRIAGGGGFPTHGHADMEIVTYMLDGSIRHRDSLGSGSIIQSDEVQRMTAGVGIKHSEFNASETESARLLQIWITPERRGLAPSYEQKKFDQASKRGRLRLVASRTGRDGSLLIHRDVDLYATALSPQARVEHEVARGRLGWIQVAHGAVTLNETELKEGDGAALSGGDKISLAGLGLEDNEVLLFDMAA